MNRKERRRQSSQEKQAGQLAAPAPGSALAKHLELGVKLRNAGRMDEARESLERAVAIDPTGARALCELAHLQRLTDQQSKAVMTLRKAARAAPKSSEVLANLAVTLRDSGEMEEALRALRRAVELRPGFYQAQSEIGATLQMMGRAAEAVAGYRASLAMDSRQPVVLANLGFACLEIGDAAGALEACDGCFALDPHCASAVVVKAYALEALGRSEEASKLMGVDRLVSSVQVEQVEGFESMQAFNAALVEHATSHPSLKLEPNQRTTRMGQQTGELNREPKGPIAALEQTLNGAVRDYLEALPREAEHPYLSHRPRKWRMSLWATILGSQGHQAPHIHPVAWVSGVYYAQLPEVVKSGSEDQQGWIEFGKAPESFQLDREMAVRRMQPREGMLVLFPSYMYHRTIPFESETQRISFAMDAVAMR